MSTGVASSPCLWYIGWMKSFLPADSDDTPRQKFDLKSLNDAQRTAVTTTEGPVLVIAGAGSGKTRTLVYRVAHLIEKHVDPERILLLTFTRKASQEMLWRAGRLLNDSCGRVMGGTFHGVANILLRRFGSAIGWGSSFTIIDQSDAEGIINLLKSSLGLKGKDKQFPSKRLIVAMLSGSVNKSIPLDELVLEHYSHLADHIDDILSMQKHYQAFKTDNGLMDYDDLLVNWKRLLQEAPDIRRQISDRFAYLMVDEYQDTNLIQADIVQLLAETHKNVMVVGDDSQSIYSFRGADFYNIMRFPRIFPDAVIVKLEENYRSCQPILSLTNAIIQKAAEKYTKTLFSNIEGADKPRMYAARDERDEARFVLGEVRNLLAKGIAVSEIAVLFRSGYHSYKLELELGSEGIDFEKRGGLKLTESAHMKDVLAFLRLLVNPHDALSWNRIFLQLDKIGPKTAQKITAAIATAGDPFARLATYPAGGSWKAGFQRLNDLFQTIQTVEQKPSTLYDTVIQYYQPVFEQLYADDYPRRQKDLDQLKTIMASYAELQAFIDDTTLDPPDDGRLHDNRTERLILSTIHSSKGLEFDAVFIIGLADGRFPHGSAGQGEQWEEERRLLYVAATRARKYLYCTYPSELMTPDRLFKRVSISPFLAELHPSLFERVARFSGESASAASYVTHRQNALHEKGIATRKTEKKLNENELLAGTRISHPFFGEGKVVKKPQGRSLDVLFDRHGLKTLHLDYAKLTLLH